LTSSDKITILQRGEQSES